MKLARLTRKTTEERIRLRRECLDNLRQMANEYAYENSELAVKTILSIISTLIEMAVQREEFSVRVGKIINFRRVHPDVFKRVIDSLSRYRYGLAHGCKAGRPDSLLIAW